MAKVKLILDTRKKSKSNVTELYPIVLRVFHKKTRYIYPSYQTSVEGWDSLKMKLKKSVSANRELDVGEINNRLFDMAYAAQMVIRDIGDAIDLTDVDKLVELIKESWDSKNTSVLKQGIINGITLKDWGDVLIERKNLANKPSSAGWYKDGINAFIKFNNGKDISLNDIDITFLRNFQAFHESKGNSKNSISAYMRSVRAIYNSAIVEDRFNPSKNTFQNFKVACYKPNEKEGHFQGQPIKDKTSRISYRYPPLARRKLCPDHVQLPGNEFCRPGTTKS